MLPEAIISLILLINTNVVKALWCLLVKWITEGLMISIITEEMIHSGNSFIYICDTCVSLASEWGFVYAVTCEGQPGFCVRGLRVLSSAGGLIRRVASPPCRGCSGVGISSFSNTEENSSLRTWKTHQGTQITSPFHANEWEKGNRQIAFSHVLCLKPIPD